MPVDLTKLGALLPWLGLAIFWIVVLAWLIP